ncbi:MAG TPA: hypothetical protein VMB66_12325 [Candidatus Acidoferrales bacterium]|nr:hypothetical protein [Candidatus Acidoferrales bacterium]
MSAGFRFNSVVGVAFLSAAILCAAPVFAGSTSTTHTKHKAKKKVDPPPPLPSGPTGLPVQQMPLDSIAAVPPRVTYTNDQLTIVAPNSTLSDILRAVRKETGAEIDVPVAPERVVTTLGPGPARDVLSDLLNGSRFNYVLLGAPGNETVLTRVVLVPKSNGSAPEPQQPAEQQAAVQGAAAAPPPDADGSANAADGDASDDNSNAVDDSADQQANDDQSNQEQPAVKTPQQMLQEMQQRQMQLQQQQPSGQPPVPGSGMPPHAPQEQ